MKRISIVDIIIIAGVFIALLVGLYTAKHFRQTADKQIEATSPIVFQVFLRGVTVTGVDFHPEEYRIVASCGTDGKVIVGELSE